MIDHAFVRKLLSASVGATRDDKLLGLLGSAVDHAADLGDEEGLQLAIEAIDAANGRTWAATTQAALHYYSANAWSSLRHLRHHDAEAAWQWECIEHEHEVLCLRRSLTHEGFAQLDVTVQCQVLTNVANVLSNIGRFPEAVEMYDRALDLDPAFGMASGNKGLCLLAYAREHYEPGHQCTMAGRAAHALDHALARPLEMPAVRAGFISHRDLAKQLSDGHNCADPEALHSHGLGQSAEEQTFRSWCLRNRLFINPLNDLGPVAIAGWDYLVLPTLSVRREIGTGFHGFYNQLKQEFASARWLFYEATEVMSPAFVDRELNLLDTLDRSAFGIALEKCKFSLRSAYSLFDKIAGFISFYLELPPSKTTYFRWFWYEGPRKNRSLRKEFAGRRNLALRALFWLSKDLADDRDNAEHHEALEPDARRIAAIRNALEHGYVKVVSTSRLWTPEPDHVPPDRFANRTTEAELVAKTLRVLKMARSALVYLSLAVHREEREKPESDDASVRRGQLEPLR